MTKIKTPTTKTLDLLVIVTDEHNDDTIHRFKSIKSLLKEFEIKIIDGYDVECGGLDTDDYAKVIDLNSLEIVCTFNSDDFDGLCDYVAELEGD